MKWMTILGVMVCAFAAGCESDNGNGAGSETLAGTKWRLTAWLVLMDVQMPRLEGIEATKRLRANPAFAHTPIVALTALAMPGDEERCLEAGANAYLSKPVGMKELIGTIDTLLAKAADNNQEKTS